MPLSVDDLREHVSYSAWASQRLVHAASEDRIELAVGGHLDLDVGVVVVLGCELDEPLLDLRRTHATDLDLAEHSSSGALLATSLTVSVL